jgi:uncharacterized cupredoxin-like copper-binding protein
MNADRTFKCALVIACLIGVGCQKQNVEKEATPFRIVATDAGFEAPAVLAAGLRHVTLENRGSKIHEAMLVKLAKGMTAEDYVAAVKKGSSFPEGALDYSGPGLTSPGQTAEMWLKVDPGQYIIICWNNGHATKTAVYPFTVEATGLADDSPPKEDLVVKLYDYQFELSGDLHQGTQVIRVETPGPSMHEMDMYRLHEGQTVENLKSWRKEEQPGPAPAEALGGVLDSHDLSHVVWLRKDFTPGRYVLQCEMPITNSKMTHTDMGMVREIEIPK